MLIKNKKYIQYYFNIILILFTLTIQSKASDGDIYAIECFAGWDQSLCPQGVLDLSTLGAYISGDVSDGNWFVMGDGKLMPGNVEKMKFSKALTYIPGPNDIAKGGFNLLLVSDDPDGDGPLVEYSDFVSVFFQSSPPLACNLSLNVSLNAYCEQLVTPQMVLSNPEPPYERYHLTLWDQFENLIPDNILRAEHIGQTISVEVTHECAYYSSCNGELKVNDKSPPLLYCFSDTIACTSDISPDSIGFPVGNEVVLIKNGERLYKAIGLDKCTDAWLSYYDEIIDYECDSEFERVINRHWKADDAYNNTVSCIQEIYIRRDSLSGVILPPHYDDKEEPALHCDDDFPVNNNGFPSPAFTGSPDVESCITLQAFYVDVPIETCGAGYKVLRKWQIIDWCTAEDINYNQIIKVVDTIAPIFDCPEDMVINTEGYYCYAEDVIIPMVKNIQDCSSTTVDYQIYNQKGDLIHSYQDGLIDQLPIGTNTVIYRVTDECGNADTCSAKITVVDNQPPTAVCDRFTKVSLGNDGTARLFAESIDDESYDNCAIFKMEVMKMDSLCPKFQGRGPFVEFCCAEAGMQTMVSFIVSDIYGNENTCMVTVTVEDKLPPKMTCPSDLTVDCRTDFDWENLNDFGKIVLEKSEREIIRDTEGNNIGLDGWVDDNCMVEIEDTFESDIECYQGTIVRTFTATDQQGNTASCQQKITIIDENPFTYEDINWPLDYKDSVCIDTAISPNISGEPGWNNEFCGQIASTYKDQLFPFAEGSCMKIIRKWTVIDWCQYDRDNEEYGIWTKDQVLKFENTVAPVFESCQDSLLCAYTENCSPALFEYVIQVSDDCTMLDELDIAWEITIDMSSNNVIKGGGINISEHLPYGKHHLKIIAEDKCGNQSFCNKEINVVDCKAPTPHCISSITTVLMQNSSSIEIWARDFDFQSFDNCTDKKDLIFSFSEDTMDQSRLLDCSDIPNGIVANKDLEMWITDLSGNQEFCLVTIRIQDNNDNCEDNGELSTIDGNIISYGGVPLENINVHFNRDEAEGDFTTQSEKDGSYAFEFLSSGIGGRLLPVKNDDPKKGLNTLDIVKIQRHILGKSPFDSPYKILAADVNNSGKITGSDLLIIRKLILGIINEMPENSSSWRFIDAATTITDDNMWEVEDGVIIPHLNPGQNTYNFVGLKIGDVDDSWNEINRGVLQTRNNSAYTFIYDIETKGIDAEVTIKTEEWIDDLNGMQFSLILPEGFELSGITSALPEFSDDNFRIDKNTISISWNSDVALDRNQVLFTINGKTNKSIDLQIAEDGLYPQIYVELDAHRLQLKRGIENITRESGMQAKILQNPFYESLIINVDVDMDTRAIVQLFDQGGRLIQSINATFFAGPNTIRIGDSLNLKAGTYFVSLITPSEKKSLKAIKIH